MPRDITRTFWFRDVKLNLLGWGNVLLSPIAIQHARQSLKSNAYYWALRKNFQTKNFRRLENTILRLFSINRVLHVLDMLSYLESTIGPIIVGPRERFSK